MKILDVPTSSISEVKKSPSDVFKKAEKEKSAVYVFNRGDVAGVMLTKEQYEMLVRENELLQEKLMDYIVEQRIQEAAEVYSDQEVRGHLANTPPTLDEQDGWE